MRDDKYIDVNKLVVGDKLTAKTCIYYSNRTYVQDREYEIINISNEDGMLLFTVLSEGGCKKFGEYRTFYTKKYKHCTTGKYLSTVEDSFYTEWDIRNLKMKTIIECMNL